MISDLLGTNHLQPVVLVGVGNLARRCRTVDLPKRVLALLPRLMRAVQVKDMRVTQSVYSMTELRQFVTQNLVRMAISVCRPRRRRSEQ